MRRKGMLKTNNFNRDSIPVKNVSFKKKKQQRKKETDGKKRFSIIKSIVFR